MRAWRHSPFRVNGARRLARRGAHCSLLLSSRMFRSSARTRGPLSPHQHLASLLVTASAAGVFPPHQTCSLGPGVDPSLPAPPSVIQPSPQRQPWDGPLPLPFTAHVQAGFASSLTQHRVRSDRLPSLISPCPTLFLPQPLVFGNAVHETCVPSLASSRTLPSHRAFLIAGCSSCSPRVQYLSAPTTCLPQTQRYLREHAPLESFGCCPRSSAWGRACGIALNVSPGFRFSFEAFVRCVG